MSTTTSRELQRLWLDARCASVGVGGQAEKMNTFLVSFLSQFATRHDKEFQRVFGTGSDLAQLVCKSFVHEGRAAPRQLATGCGRGPSATISYLHSLLSALVILVSGFTVDEVTYFAPLYELLADSNVISCALLLHHYLSEHRPSLPAPDTAHGAPSGDLVAVECLKLTTQILACPHEGLVRRCALEAAQPANVEEMCRVLTTSIRTPYSTSEAECSLVQGHIRRITPIAATQTVENTVSVLEESLVTCSCPPPAPTSSSHTDSSRSGFAVSLACLMETIVELYKALSRPFRDHFSFGAFASAMICAEDVLEVHPKSLLRIVTCVETIAVSPLSSQRRTASEMSPVRQGLMKFVPGSLQTLKQKIVDATASAPAKPLETDAVTCPEAFECLVTLFVCSTRPITAKYYGECVMRLVQLPSATASLADFFLRSGVESISSLQAQQLSVLFESALALTQTSHDVVSTFVGGVVRALGRDGLTTIERRSLTLDYLSAASEASQVRKGIILGEGALCASLEGIVPALKQNPAGGAALLSKASILSKVLVDGPDCVADLTAQRYPAEVIKCMLACFSADLSAATLVLRDMLTNLVSKTGHFFAPLIAALASSTQGSPWRPESSLLLATFVSALQRGKHVMRAIESNAVELLLTLLCQVDNSTVPNLDVHLIGTTLAFLLRVLRFSDVWVLFDATITSLPAEPVLVQMVVDLCCGVFHTPTSLQRCYAVFDGATAARHNAEPVERLQNAVFGVFQVPDKPFVELDYPLRALVKWCDACGDSERTASSGRDDTALRDLMAYLFASCPRRFDNDILIPFIVRWHAVQLLNKVANIADPRLTMHWVTTDSIFRLSYTEAAEEIGARQNAWCAALSGEASTSTPNPSRVLFLGEAGGISGTATCGSEQWPSRDGYSVAMWVRWDVSQSTVGAATGADVTVPLWRLSWTGNRKTYTVTLIVRPCDETVAFACEGGETVGKVRAPSHTVRPGFWAHIVVVHDRSSFNASEAAIYVDGRRVAAAPCSFPAPSWQPSLQGSVLGANPVEIACAVGSSTDRPTRWVRLDLMSWKVFNQSLSFDEITSLYCSGAQPTGGRLWSARTGQEEFLLDVPTYSHEVVKGLEMCALAGSFPGRCSSADMMLTLSPPTTRVLLDVDVRSLAPRDTDETHFHSQEWYLHSATTVGVPTLFVLLGSWTAGACEEDCSSDVVSALLAHGGTEQLRLWMRWLRQPLADSQDPSLRNEVAVKLLQVISLCRHQDVLPSETWGDVLVELCDTIAAAPAAFFGSTVTQPEKVVELLLSLCIANVRTSVSQHATPLVYCTILLEHLLFNWRVLVSTDVVVVSDLLNCFASLLESHNPFAALNATRFRRANFEDGFVYGLFMEWVPPFTLQSAVRVVGLYLRAVASSTHEPVSKVLTLCALSVPGENGDCRLGSQMILACPLYVALVRNLLLRTLNEACDAATADSGVGATARQLPSSLLLLDQICEVVPPCWFSQMVSAASHPVTVTLSCRLFVLCFHRSDQFRSRHVQHGTVCFGKALGRYAHHEDVLTLFFDGFAEHMRNLPTEMDVACRRAILSDAWDTTCARQRYAPLLTLVLQLVKAQSEALLSDQCTLCYPPLDTGNYLAHFALQASRTCSRVAKLRRCCLAVLFCVRMRHSGRGEMIMDLGSGAATSTCVPSGGLRRHLTRLVSLSIQRLASVYETSSVVRAVLYSQGTSVNGLDALMWPILSAVRVTSVHDPDRARPAEDGVPGRSATTTLSGDDRDCDNNRDNEEALGCESGVDGSASKAGFCSLPCLDRLMPGAQMDEVFDATQSFFFVHACHYVRQADPLPAAAGKANLSGFVLALHRALTARPVAFGTETENRRAAFLCTIWIKVTEHSLDAFSNDAPSPVVAKNVMALGKYLLSRLVSGLPTPPETLAAHFRLILTRFERQRELLRFARTALFEWFMFIANKSYFRTDSEVAEAAVNMISSTCDVLLTHTFPTAEMAQIVAVRLIELTLVILTEPTPSERTEKNLCAIWTAYLNAHQQSPCVSFLYVGDGASDAWLLSPSASTVTAVQCPTWECFRRWFSRFHVGFLQILRAQPLNFEFSLAEPNQHAKLSNASEKQRADELRRLRHRQNEVVEAAAKEWSFFQSTATVVDPALLRGRANTSEGGGSSPTAVAMRGSWTLLASGETTWVPEASQASAPGGYCQQPLRRFLRHPPPPCIPMRATSREARVGPCKLYRNAVSLLTRLASTEAPASPLWVGNVYHVVGIESHVSTLILTDRELLIVRCSQVTPDGDFFIARIQPHTASTQSRRLKANTIYSTLRRFLPSRGAVRSGSATQSAAAFRFSQYYRQLRSDTAGTESATICRVPLTSLSEVHERLFLHLPAAVEFVLECGDRLLVVVLDEELSFSRQALQQLIQTLQERAVRVSVDTIAAKRSRLTLATRRWVSREISNRQYLTVLNDAASRTTADLSQYPVMPWVLANYSTDKLDLSDASVYRRLDTPVGALDSARAQHLRDRYRDWVSDSDEPPFHFGTHYSTSAIVMYYLVRLEPLTTWARGFQGGKLDLPDRLFHSVHEAWESSSGGNAGDVKELIPEFFTTAAFLLNRNEVALGVRRDGVPLGNVVLPPWALNSPHRFVHFNGLALESEFVSTHLNEWIDLIFGFKQQGEEAAKAVNVFSYTSYREGVEAAINRATTEEERKSIVASVDNFGQTPPQLFTGHTPHPVRVSPDGLPTTQQYLRQRVSELRATSQNAATSVGSRTYAVSQLIYVATQEQLLSCSWLETAAAGGLDNIAQLFVYDTCRDAVQCYLRGSGRLLAVTPTIESFGCGQYTAMCTTTSGNILFIGTSSGTVIVFSRNGTRGGYGFQSLLHTGSAARNRVVGMQIAQDRNLLVFHEHGCLVRGWCVSMLGVVFAFETPFACPSDDSPVIHVTILQHPHVLVAVKSQSLFFFANDGTVLTVLARDAVRSLLEDSGATAVPTADALMTAVCLLNCDSFDTHNMLFLGYDDGTVCVWMMEAAHRDSDTAALFTLHYTSSVHINVAVTCLCAIEATASVAVGGADGKTRLFCFPTNDSSDSD